MVRRAGTLTALFAWLLFASFGVTFSADVPIATIAVGNAPQAIACDPTAHLVYVCNFFGDSVSVIDGASDTVTKTISMPTTGAIGAGSIAAVTDPTRGIAYIANWQSNRIAFIDRATLTVPTVTIVPAINGGHPRALALDPSTTPPKLYVANYSTNSISVLNAVTGVSMSEIPVGPQPRALGIFSSVTRHRLYVAYGGSADVTIIDSSSDSIVATVTMDARGKTIAVHPTTGVAYVTVPSTDKVVVIGTGDSMTTSVTVGDNPVGAGVLASADRLLVANYASGDYTAISTTSNAVVATAAIGPGPFNVAVDQSDGKWYVTHMNGSTISSIDSALTATTVTVGVKPHSTAIDEAATPHEAFVTNETSDSVTVVDEPLMGAAPALGVQEAHAAGASRLTIAIDPLPGDSTASTTPLITGTVDGVTSPFELAIVGVWYRVDADPVWRLAEISAGAGSANVTWEARPATLSAGPHTIRVMAMDQGMTAAYSSSAEGAQGGGSTEDPAVYAFSVGDEAPVTTISGIPAGWSSADVTFTLTATDTAPGVAGTYYASNGGAPQAYGLPVGVFAEGTTTVGYWSVDTSGNAEATKTATILIDKTAPGTADDAAAGYAGSASISLVASDALSGVAGTRFRLDGGESVTGSIAATSAAGAHTLEYASVDEAGNTEATRSAVFEVHAIPPGGDGANVPEGSGVVVTVGGFELTFPQVTEAGSAILTPIATPSPRLPGYTFPEGAADIDVDCAFTGPVQVRAAYAGVPEAAERSVLLWHWDGSSWVDITTGRDVAANTVTGLTPGFSPFGVGYSPWEPTSTSNAGSLATPHKGYSASTNKCAVCHAVHAAEVTGTVLLPAPAAEACEFCHIDTALGVKRIYAGVRAAYTTDHPCPSYSGGFAHNAPDATCVACHSTHGAGTLDGGNTSKILKDWMWWRAGPGAMNDYSTYALSLYPAPSTVSNKYNQQTAFCTGCHKYLVPSYLTTVPVVEGATWVDVSSHVMTASGNPYANPAASLIGTTVAWAPSVNCRDCHNAGAVDTTGGVVSSSFPHYTPQHYRFATVGSSVTDSGSANTTGTVDGMCLRCHRDGAGAGVGLGF